MDDGRKAKTYQSPNHSDIGNNVHNEEQTIEEVRHLFNYLMLMGITCRPMIVGNHNMERFVIKASASQSPIPSDKGSNVQNKFQAPKMQTIHFWDDLYFSSPVIPLTPCMIRSVVKDDNNVQIRDKADRSQMVSDMPEVLDTHLTKEDAESNVPQNNLREGIFSLRWKHLQVHQVIVLFLLTIRFAQGISSYCETSQTMNNTQLFLTCSFDTDIFQLKKNLYMSHVQKDIDIEIILVCQMSLNGSRCEASPTYEFVSVQSKNLTIKIPEINSKHVGKYWCNVQITGIYKTDHKVCEVSLPDTSSAVSDINEEKNGSSCKDTSSAVSDIIEQKNGSSSKERSVGDDGLKKYIFVAIIVVCLLLVVSVCINVYMCVEKRKRIQEANKTNFVDTNQHAEEPRESLRYKKENVTEEELEPLPNHSDGN